jgi:hypothetical protein
MNRIRRKVKDLYWMKKRGKIDKESRLLVRLLINGGIKNG